MLDAWRGTGRNEGEDEEADQAGQNKVLSVQGRSSEWVRMDQQKGQGGIREGNERLDASGESEGMDSSKDPEPSKKRAEKKVKQNKL